MGICNGHGPLLRFNVDELVGGYKRWSEDALEKAKAKTAVFYTSDYASATACLSPSPAD